MSEPAEQIGAALAVIRDALARHSLLGIYLYGSAVAGGLRPDSDVDILAVTAHRLADDEKRRLIAGLLPISGAETRAPGWRPLEVTVVAQPDVRPWRYPPRWELQYGEWLRPAFLAGDLAPWPEADPDLAVLLAMVLDTGRALAGPPPGALLDPVPRDDLARAMVDELPQLLGDLEADTRNVLLTFARMWCTLETGEIRSKDAAADWALQRLPDEHRSVLARARDLYLVGGLGDWTQEVASVQAAAGHVTAEIRRAARH